MAFKLSTGMRNFILGTGSIRDALQNGYIGIYSGSQPSDANAAATAGNLLAVITNASAAHTNETVASGTVTLATGAAGSVDTITVNGVSVLLASVPYNGSLTQTAADVVTAINANKTSPEYVATSAANVITIKAVVGSGSNPNGFVVASTATTITTTDVNMAGGVDPANGLTFAAPSGAVITKGTEAWTGVATAGGTAQWYRFYGSQADAGALDSNEEFLRVDGQIASSGGELTMSSTTVTLGATQTVTAYQISLPTA